MAKFSFGAFNKDFLFELPEGLWEKENFIKPADAESIYGDGVIPIIGYGVNTIDRTKNPHAVSSESGWVATAKELINVPSFQIPEIKAMMEDFDAVEACRSGHMGATLKRYENQYGENIKFIWCDR